MTIWELKQDFVDYLGTMDKTKMNMVDLSVYGDKNCVNHEFYETEVDNG